MLILKIDNRNSNQVSELLKRKPFMFITSYTEYNQYTGNTRVIDIFSTPYNRHYVKKVLISNGYNVSQHSIRNELKVSVKARDKAMYGKPRQQWENEHKNFKNNY